MELQTYKQTKIKIIDGFNFDGTLECAKEIYQRIKNLNCKEIEAFEFIYDFETNSFKFIWGVCLINKGDLVALRDNDGFNCWIEVMTQVELKRWGYELEK